MLLLSKETMTTDFNHGAYQHYWSTLKQGRNIRIAEWVLPWRIKDYLFSIPLFLYCNPVDMSALWHDKQSFLVVQCYQSNHSNYIHFHVDILQTFFAVGIQEVICTRTNMVLFALTEMYAISAKIDFKLLWKIAAIFFSFLNIDCCFPEELLMVSLPTCLDFLCGTELVQSLRLRLCQDE